MISVLIADDDPLVRSTLRDYVPWSEFDMEVIAVAEDGEETLALCRERRPDVLFTDIRMPVLTGLDVAIYLQEEAIPTKVVLVSGVQDFEYVRTALAVGAEDYILKPIKLEEIRKTARRLRDIIDLEVNRETAMARLSLQAAESAPLMRDKFLHDLLSGGVEEGELGDKLAYFGIPIDPDESVAIAVAEIDDYARLVEGKPMEYRHFIASSVATIMDRAAANGGAGICVRTGDNEFAVVFNEAASFGEGETRTLETMKEMLRKFQGITISVGIGDRRPSLEQASSSYRSARTALAYKFYAGGDSIIRIEDVQAGGRSGHVGPNGTYFAAERLKRSVATAIGLGDTEKLEETLEAYFASVTGMAKLERALVHRLCVELVIAVYQEFREAAAGETAAGESSLLSRYLSATADLQGAETIPAMREAVSVFAHAVAESFKRKYKGRNQEIVRRIRAYVEAHVGDDVSLADIAEEVCLSINYACAVFKKETGETINDHLIKTKMERAKRMLADTKLKIWEIAEALGYENHHYFSYSFKKYSGTTPQQFRSL